MPDNKKAEQLRKARRELKDIIDWVEGCYYDVDTKAFNDACSNCYMVCKSATHIGVVGYTAGELKGKSIGVDDLVKCFLMLNEPMTFRHVDLFRKLEHKK